MDESLSALYKKNELAIPAPLNADFAFNGTTYRVDMSLELTAALASHVCKKCGKSTRQIQSELGVQIPSDDQLVNILEITYTNQSKKHSESVLEAEYVSVITSIEIERIDDIDSMIEISDEDSESDEIKAHVKNILLGQLVCDGCTYKDNYIGSLLEK